MKGGGLDEFRRRYGPWALVAGASEGLGAEFARQLAGKGLDLALVARRAGKLEALAGELAARYGVQTRSLSLDLSNPETPGAILAQVEDIEVGLLVYNASFSCIGPFFDRSLAEHRQELQVNCLAPLALVHSFGRSMAARRRGGIILMSSLSASQGSAYISNYTATKAYNQILAEGLWEELREHGVDVLACSPGATRTPNYLASLDGRPSGGSVPAIEPRTVVTEALAALGKEPGVIPGFTNRLSALVMRRILPRRTAIRLMGRVLKGLYVR